MSIPENYLRCMHRPPTLRQPIPAPKTVLERVETTEPTKDSGTHSFTIYGAPLGKPRMTRRDKWKQRPCVMRYRAWADKAREAAGELPKNIIGLSWVAYLPMPKSWSKAKRERMRGQLHQQKPDRDNIDKAILDALLKSDCGVAQGTLEKRWDDGQGPRIFITITTPDNEAKTEAP